MGLKKFYSSRVTKMIDIEGEQVEIFKLSLRSSRAIREISDFTKLSDEEKEEAGVKLLRQVIRLGSTDGEAMTDDDFENVPMDIQQKIAEEIMEFSGMSSKKAAEAVEVEAGNASA